MKRKQHTFLLLTKQGMVAHQIQVKATMPVEQAKQLAHLMAQKAIREGNGPWTNSMQQDLKKNGYTLTLSA